MASKVAIDPSLLNVPVVVQEISFEGNKRIKRESLSSFIAPIYKSKNLHEVLSSAQKAIGDLNTFNSLKDIKISLEDANNDNGDRVPVIIKFIVSEKGFGLKSGLEISRNEPCLYFNGQVFNVANKIGRLSILSCRGIHNYRPLEIVYDGFFGPFKSSLGVFFNAKESHEFFTKNISSAYITLAKRFGSVDFSGCFKVVDEIFSTSKVDISHRLRRNFANIFTPSASFTVTKSSLDTSVLPTSGYKLETSINFLMPFQRSIFVKCQSKCQAHYHFKNLTLSGYFFGGLLLPSGNVGNISDRFYAGGHDNIRSFKFNSLGSYIDGYNTGSGSVLNYTVCLSHNFNSSLRNKLSAGIFYCNSLMPNEIGAMRQLSINSSVGLFLAANMSESARLEISYGIPIQVVNPSSGLRGIQFGISMENSFS